MSEGPPPKKKERKKEDIGTVIYTGGSNGYSVEGLLGSGGFCDVYTVHLTKNKDKKFAMKTERFDFIEENKRRMKVEMCLFETLQADSQKMVDRSHFPKMIDSGKTPEYSFIIMEIVGHSLIDIRLKMMGGKTSPRTIAEIAKQTLKAMESLHELGWLHRDIKPHNFAIGLPPKETTIFMLDFGLARPYREKDGRIRIPRRNPRWGGTIRYASARGMKGEEQARRDDVEIWCYMMLEYYYKQNLIWSHGKFEKPMMIAIKEKVMTDPKDMITRKQIRMPARFCEILMMTSKLTFTANPDYPKMNAILEEIIKDEKIDMTLPLDWVGRTMPVEDQKLKDGKGLKGSEISMSDLSKGVDKASRAKELKERRKMLEDELRHIEYEEQKKQKRKRRRSRDDSKRDEEEESERSEDDYSEEDSRRNHRRRRRGGRGGRGKRHSRRDDSDRGRDHSPPDDRRRRKRSDRKKVSKASRAEKASRNERKRITSDRERADNEKDKAKESKKTPEKPEEKEDRRKTPEKSAEVEKEKGRKKTPEKPDEKEKETKKEAKEGKKLSKAEKPKEKEKKEEDKEKKKGEGKKKDDEKKNEESPMKKDEKDKKSDVKPKEKEKKPEEKEKISPVKKDEDKKKEDEKEKKKETVDPKKK